MNSNKKIILITGGARSGKSSFAEKYVSEIGKKIAYIATAIPFDDGMKNRIKRHRESRPSEWTTFEMYRDIYKHIQKIAKKHDTVLLDCMTIMITNLMFDNSNIDWDKVDWEEVDDIENDIKEQIVLLIDEVKKAEINMVIVTNELGMGIVPESRLSRIFRDIAGRMNQLIAGKADEVYFIVSGIPVKIK
ncbi:adenosylcobinamide kinase /adenosylcobinamide-phosphate guanylyltransferase [Caminicella sporogenes DSM 14501]|uniref:Bifunctional adenosylcobalamin biosynthesis protein CobU n=1 Tax=Caminicella sporogenes DSM 14501 TaxID=1121266 RepID=A0A1M6MU22_9FIRM|nr:bifunctional adenosylcobinamide kinase/adenosylcobinamide-phosphate guanylyltransferase [Caminicella sporogenes]RKD22498.1 bifunctional adenosylcobinamide kinase/adenosylcobinamide-phosphate guanylyltransferase [Caminicella sporogenes]SHJ87015.1 adenosylcobinamide kinase /adenosylcobinamide-phosphate guanylyltransferase [Caminicella sporogenes DSM 14501]